MVILGLSGLAALVFLFRPLRFGMMIALGLLAGHLWFHGSDGLIYTDRSFFGVMLVRERTCPMFDPDDEDSETAEDEPELARTYVKHTLIHGSTNHGEQSFHPLWRRKAITYYFPSGPIGEVFTKLIDPQVNREIGIAGLGTGSTAAFGQPGQRITYFEIDAHVRRIAENPKLFSYLNDTPADYEIVMGDARLSLEKQPDAKFDLLLMDAFSSDAIPIHMITKEAVELFFKKLKPGGILLVHISNRHLDLAPVVGNIARELGLVARLRGDRDISPEEDVQGKFASDVVALVRDEKRLGSLARDSRWAEIPPDDPKHPVGVWTDDFSNILTVIEWLRPAKAAEQPPEADD
jgi:hypothetical protein